MAQAVEHARRRVPIRRRVLAIVLLTTLAGLVAAGIAAFISIGWIQSSEEAALTTQLEDNLKSTVEQKAASANAKLEHYEKYIEFITDYIEGMYANKEEMIGRGRMFYAPRDTTEYVLTRGFASEDMSEADVADELRFFSNLENIWEPIVKANEDLITTVYAGTTSGLLSSYDRWSFLSPMPEGKELIYDFFESNWYQQGMEEDSTFYTGLYVDSQGRGLTITVASPFKDENGQFAGVDCADFDITTFYDELLAVDLGEGTFSFALDRDGNLITTEADGLTTEESVGLSKQGIEQLRTDPDGVVEMSDAVYVCTPIERVDWTLCVRVPREIIQDSVHDADRSIQNVSLFLLLAGILIVICEIIAVNKAASSITKPMEMLEHDMKIIADGDLNYRATVYRNDEIGDVTSRMNEMVDRLNFTMNELISSQQHANAMSKLATRDSLTGIRNKTAFDEQKHVLEQDRSLADFKFGFAMIDLNNLKLINDNYGHDKGDIAIMDLSRIVCKIFAHSPVFRIGGDEFVVVLKDRDYRNIDDLVAQFKEELEDLSSNKRLEPWKRISAAIGYALYDKENDKNTSSVLSRADQEMYKCKRAMKATR